MIELLVVWLVIAVWVTCMMVGLTFVAPHNVKITPTILLGVVGWCLLWPISIPVALIDFLREKSDDKTESP